MPYDTDDFEIIQVPLPKNSPVLAHLKEEARKYRGRAFVGPHIAALLTDRDGHVYGGTEGNGKGIWFPPNYMVPSLVTIPTPIAIVEKGTLEAMEQETLDMIAGFKDDDD